VRGSSGGNGLRLAWAFPWPGNRKLFEFFGHRGQIGGGRLFEQLRLLGRQALRLDAEALPLVVRQLIGELVDLGLTPCDQQAAQFVSVESVKVGGQRHASNHADQRQPTIVDFHNGISSKNPDHAAIGQTLPGQAQNQGVELALG
jgi:hypothetical protein